MPSLNEVYQLDHSDNPVVVEVTIGHAGTAETVLKINGKKKNDLFKDSFTSKIGTNKKLHGSTLDVRTFVAKLPVAGHASSITLKLTGGVNEQEWTLKDSSDDNPVPYVFTIGLFH